MASSTKSIVKSSYASSWNVQVAELEFDYSQVGDHSAVQFDLIGEVKLPANSYVLDTQVHGIIKWVSGGAVSMIVGDDSSASGFHLATDLKAVDLLGGEANTMEHPGGLAGTYTANSQRKFYSASARTVIAKLSVAHHATAVSAGKTRVLVMYCCPPTDSVKP
ncbi:MAG: hypothetical protein H8E12_17445 [Rhodobacteraceae bacterium]|nr:hypothetical protein [Paracoccaceae bacterium]